MSKFQLFDAVNFTEEISVAAEFLQQKQQQKQVRRGA